MEKITKVFKQLWDTYYQQNPQVPAIQSLLEAREKPKDIINDHIALRTFQHPLIGIDKLSEVFINYGFVERDHFDLPDKKVFAKYFSHPSGQWPRVFISELIIRELNTTSQAIIEKLIIQIPQDILQNSEICLAGRPWNISHSDYQILLQNSEYAAWLAAHGFQMNHATVSVNHMKSISTLEELNQLLQDNGFTLNGENNNQVIQAAKNNQGQIVLKQSSTIASKVPITFSDGTFVIPGCYYEFIQRFHNYDSFDPGNATKIMESTNVQQ